MLTNPDFAAAAEPWKTRRPFEAWFDASDMGWCVRLTQRDVAGGTPRTIAMISKSFIEEAIRWSACEREFYAFKKGYYAIAKYDTGFILFMYFCTNIFDCDCFGLLLPRLPRCLLCLVLLSLLGQ